MRELSSGQLSAFLGGLNSSVILSADRFPFTLKAKPRFFPRPLSSTAYGRFNTPAWSRRAPHPGEMSSTHIPASWLFVRGDDSIRIYRPSATALRISGPHHELIRPEFFDEGGLESFLAEVTAALEDAGWLALGEGYERRRNKTDRRRNPRVPTDRRS